MMTLRRKPCPGVGVVVGVRAAFWWWRVACPICGRLCRVDDGPLVVPMHVPHRPPFVPVKRHQRRPWTERAREILEITDGACE